MISALALFPTRSLFSAPGLLQLQHCTPVRCPSTAQLCHRCTFTLCCGIQQQLCIVSSCPMFPTQSLFPAHTHDFSSCPVSPVKFHNKLTPVISALAVSAHIFILSSLSVSAPALHTVAVLQLCTALAQTPLHALCCGFQQQLCTVSACSAFPPSIFITNTRCILSELPLCAPMTLYFQLMCMISALAMFSPKKF